MALLEFVGVLIGFSMVMLLLSLLVTALVQAVVHMLGTRSANLRWGLEHVLNQVLNDPAMATQVARDIINLPRAPVTLPVPAAGGQSPPAASNAKSGPAPASPAPSESLLQRTLNGALNPPQTWIKPDELPRMVQTHCTRALSESDMAETAERFARIDPYLRNRFTYHTRLITIAVSALVAFGFQVSATDLLARLTRDKALRDDYVNQAEDLRDQAEGIMDRIPGYDQVSEQALDTLAQRHPDLRPQIEEASGIGDTKYVLWDELERALPDTVDDHDAIVAEYQQLLEELHGQAVKQSLGESQDITQKLAGLNIRFWEHGLKYYDNAGNWLGVAMTAVLLTLGAPFWFKMLNNLIQLRDALKPPDEGKKTDGDAASVAAMAAAAGVAAAAAAQPAASGGTTTSPTSGSSQFRNFTP